MLYNNKTTKLLNLQNFALRSSAEQTEKRLSEWIHIAGISLFAVFRYCTRMLKSWLDGIIRFFVSQLFTKSKKAPCVFRCTELQSADKPIFFERGNQQRNDIFYADMTLC